MAMSLNYSSEAYLGPCQMPVMRLFLQKQFMSFNRLLFSQKSFTLAARHNPKCASDIFLTIFTAELPDGLKQTFKFLEQLFFKTSLRSDSSLRFNFFISMNLNFFHCSLFGTQLLSLFLSEILELFAKTGKDDKLKSLR